MYYLAGTQSVAGFWHRPASPNRAPIQDGDVSRTALAINALAHWAVPARKAELAVRVERGAAWLAAQEPASTEDRVMQPWSAVAGAPIKQRDVRIKQRRAALPTAVDAEPAPSRPTPTRSARVVLRARRAQSRRPSRIQRADAFPVRTQQDDGTWQVKSRAMPIQPYFESGFPYEHDQWFSFSGTAWADMALAMTVPLDAAAATGAPRYAV